MAEEKQWFDTWFNTPYYHILYKNRDDQEAERFMDNLTSYLSVQENETILDLACGKGRHSRYLNGRGFNVEGIDLSTQSIEFAKQFENDRLKFAVHDMRLPYKDQHFNYILNLFTSFGYFEKDEENQIAMNAIAKGLAPQGKLVVDFFNTHYVLKHLVQQNTVHSEGIDFYIERKVENGQIVKTIKFRDKGQSFFFAEKVQALQLKDFERLFKGAGLRVLEVLGDYSLSPYVKDDSERMIFITEPIEK